MMQDYTNKKSKWIEKLILFFKQSAEETKDQVPEGVCPNCWGAQEYDNKVRGMSYDKQIDITNHTANHAFIQEFVVKQLNGILLVKRDDQFLCPTCLRKYH